MRFEVEHDKWINWHLKGAMESGETHWSGGTDTGTVCLQRK